MAAALRSVRRQVLLLHRISVTAVRAESGGKGSPPTGISKTLVSFPVKISHFQQAATGENRNEPLKPVKALQQYVAGLDGQSDREMEIGQEVPYSSAQSVDGASHKEDSSSSSSSDSSSDSEGEGPVTDLHTNKGESGEGHQGFPPATRKAPSSPVHTSLEKESPVPLEQKDRTGMRCEDLQYFAPAVTTEEQCLHPHPLPTKKTLPGADKMETHRVFPTPGASSTAAADSKAVKGLSTSKEFPAGAVETSASMSGKTQILSTTTSEELPAGAVETSASMSGKTQILSTTTSEELPAGAAETSASVSGKTQILSTTTSEELPAGAVETSASVSGKTQILSTTTSQDLPVQEEAAELHESYSPPEPLAAPQEPFDNTKYQNLQHFNYTHFTFVDLDVELAKFRLPQPSSGRQSPRH